MDCDATWSRDESENENGWLSAAWREERTADRRKPRRVPNGAARNTDARQFANDKWRLPISPITTNFSFSINSVIRIQPMQRREFRQSSMLTLFPSLYAYTSSHMTFQRANVLRSQGFTPDNNPELQNLLRFISNLQTQQAQQNGMFPFTLHILLR